MSDNSKIEWTNATWPVIAGCSYESPGCANCYAVRDSRRLASNPHPDVAAAYKGTVDRLGGAPGQKGTGKLRWTNKLNLLFNRLEVPLSWKKPRMIFVCNESDLFHPAVPYPFIDRVMLTIWQCPYHQFQVLTKRAANMRKYFSDPGLRDRLDEIARKMNRQHTERSVTALRDWPLPTLWLGVSVENEKFKHRIDDLLKTPAAIRFVSFEPLLGDVGDLSPYLRPPGVTPRLSWGIPGGESGPGARPHEIEWSRNIIRQFQAAGVPVFMKQVGSSPIVVCPDCQKRVGRGVQGGWVESCGPAHTALIAESKRFANNRKGGDPDDWPEDLRVREFPC